MGGARSAARYGSSFQGFILHNLPENLFLKQLKG